MITTETLMMPCTNDAFLTYVLMYLAAFGSFGPVACKHNQFGIDVGDREDVQLIAYHLRSVRLYCSGTAFNLLSYLTRTVCVFTFPNCKLDKNYNSFPQV